MKTIILTLISVLSLISCSSNDDDFTPQNIEPILVGKGSLMGSEGISPQNLVINNQQDWDNILSLIDENRIEQLFTSLNVDFSNHKLICVFDNVYNNLGHEVTISSIIENENNVIVTIQSNYIPTIIPTMEQPFHIVKVPLINKPIVFE